MFWKILYATDFSEVSTKALDYIKELRSAGTEEVVVLHVVDSRYLEYLLYDAKRSLDAETDMHRHARAALEPVRDELAQVGFRVSVRVETAVPFLEILRIEEEEKPSLIVMGSHGKSNIKEMLLGSVSAEVLRKSLAPVLIIKR
ncbi:MAG: universal stress protein [Syntrophaceae bacterium]|nr:universal stress protein [Deltaproteobacteria bacterium]